MVPFGHQFQRHVTAILAVNNISSRSHVLQRLHHLFSKCHDLDAYLVLIKIYFIPFLYFLLSLVFIEKIYQALKTLYQSKQLEVGQKYSEHSSYFQLSSRCRKMCSNTVFRIWYITSQLRNYRLPKSYPPGLCQRCEPKKRLIFS